MADVRTDFFRSELEVRQHRLRIALEDSPGEASLTRLLEDVDTALGRIEKGAFGLCETCHEPIEPERLMADPLVRWCVDHLTAEDRRALDEDLALALQIQNSLLPQQPLTMGDWEITYHFQPLGPVSGDYCDVVPVGGQGDRFVFLVGDVSGKGVAASLLMSHLHAIFRSLVSVGLPVPEAMERANRVFCESTMSSQYATLICGLAGPHGEIELSNAGHCAPLVLRRRSTESLATGGMPLGLFCSGRYPVGQVNLEPGDALVLYTDGLTEATNRSGEEFGPKRLAAALSPLHGQSAAVITKECIKNAQTFLSGRPPQDDLTVMVIRRSGEPGRLAD
jgi:sigma-B regulation protein RsbU (phosphoserine phosphatase)